MANDVVRRDYRGISDLPDLVRFGQRIWTVDHRWHIGDLAWDVGLEPDVCDEWLISFWECAGEIVGVGWLTRPDRLSVVLGPDHALLFEDIIGWADDLAGTPVTVTVLDTESWLVDTLDRLGYAIDAGGPFFLQMVRDLDALPSDEALPDGYTVRTVRDDELAARAELHRAVWQSPMSDERFGTMTRQWPYRHQFDFVVQAPDGALVSYILGWYDDINRVGEFEPVGTLTEYRRRGLSRAAGIALLHAFRAAGGERAIVYARGDDDYPIPRQVYASLGFAPHGRTVRYQPATLDQ